MATKLPTGDRASMLRAISTDSIEKLYREGDITALDKNRLLREKARVELDELVEGKGYINAVLQKTIDNVKEGWENIVDSATHEQMPERPDVTPMQAATKNTGRELWYAGQAAWGQIQILTSVFNAIGEVTGHVAEKTALRHGASPGLAWLIGTAVDLGSGALIPTGAVSKSVVKTGQAAVSVTKKFAAASNPNAEARFMAFLTEALQRDGIKEAPYIVGRAAGKTASEVTEVGKAVKAAGEVAPEGYRGATSFLKDMQEFASGISKEQARKELPGLMKKFGVNFNDLKSIAQLRGGKGRAYTAEQFYGYLKALEKSGDELSKAARLAIAPDATDFERMQFAKMVSELFTGPSEKPKYSKAFTDLIMHWDPVNVANGDLNAAMRTFATDMAQLTPAQTARITWQGQQGFIKFGEVGRGLREVFANIMLPLAWAPSLLSNTMGAGNMIAERLASGHAIEAAYMTKGMMLAIGDGLKAAGAAYRISNSRSFIQGIAGKVVNNPSDNLVAMDNFFKIVMLRGSLYADGLRAAAGVPNKAAFVRNFVQNPTKEAFEAAIERAYRGTYQNDLGRWMSQFRPIAQSGPGFFWFTFVKSPINLVKYSWDRTPGLQMFSSRLWQDILAGGTLADDAMARMTLSWMQGMFVWELAKEGFITGGPPADPQLRKAWLATHVPYSIGVPGGKRVPYNYLDPATMPIAMVADMAQFADQLEPDELGKLGMAAQFAFMRNIADRTMWRGFSDLVDVIQGRAEARGVSKKDVDTVANPLVGLGTGGTLLSRTRQVEDPVQRDARDLLDSVRSRVPGWSEKVPPLRDGYGDVIIPPQTLGPSWFGYFSPLIPKIKPAEDSRIKLEGDRLQAKLPAFPDFIGRAPRDDFSLTNALPEDGVGVAISPQERDRWKQIYRNIIMGAKDEQYIEDNPGIERGLLDTEEYQTAPRALKRKLFENFMSNAKSAARDALLLEKPELHKKVLNANMGQVLPLLNEEERPAAQAEYQEAIGLLESMSGDERDNLAKWGILEPDQPKTQEPVSILGVEVLGERTYQPATPTTPAPGAK